MADIKKAITESDGVNAVEMVLLFDRRFCSVVEQAHQDKSGKQIEKMRSLLREELFSRRQQMNPDQALLPFS